MSILSFVLVCSIYMCLYCLCELAFIVRAFDDVLCFHVFVFLCFFFFPCRLFNVHSIQVNSIPIRYYNVIILYAM